MRQHPPAAETDYAIPEQSGEVLIVPPYDQVAGLLGAAGEAPWGDADVLGTPLAEFRRRVRARALALALAYTRGGPPSREAGPAPPPARGGGPPGGRPLILMGHQPVFFHPGVWMKFFLLARLAAEHGATGVHLIVDTDATGTIAAEVPAARERLARAAETLVDLPDDMPLEAAPPPPPEAWAAFVERVRHCLVTLPSPVFVEHLNAFASGEPAARRAARTLAEFLGRLRRGYEARANPTRTCEAPGDGPGGSPGYLELPVSRLADTPEFRAFALHLVRSPDALQRIYNASLDEYRRVHHLRSAANPFPNLNHSSSGIETPFWVVSGGHRSELFAARRGAHVVLATAAGPVATIAPDAGGVEALGASGVAIRPRAMTLTLFARLCLGDLFIHGVSGGRYDRVTDVISAQVFGCRPPAYMVATATLHPPLLAGGGATGQRQTLERRLMDLRHNPDRYLAAPADDQRRLVDEKWSLIRAVETMRAGPDRRAATRRIREVNGLLAEALASEIAALEARLAALETAQDTEEAARYRGYPFFMFDPAEVCALAGTASGSRSTA